MNFNDILKFNIDIDEISDSMDDVVGGFEKKPKKDPNKKVRQDTKKISKEERKRVKKRRKEEKQMESVMNNDWQMI